MNRQEAEAGVRHFASTWCFALPTKGQAHPSFNEFKAWLRANGHGSLLQFCSTMGADDEAERWFDDELKQDWRS